MRLLRAVAVLLSVWYGIAGAESPTGLKFDKPAVEAYLRHLLLWTPNVEVTMSDPVPAMTGYYRFQFRGSLGGHSQEAVFFISADGKTIFRGDVFDLGKSPFQDSLDQLKLENQPFLGTPGAPVTVVEFADFQCPFCKQEADVAKTKLLEAFPKDVQLYWVDFPLEPIHPYARGAAIMGRCIYSQSNASFWAYHDWAFAHQGELTADNLKDKVMGWAASEKNLDTAKLSACSVAPEPRKDVDREEALGEALHATSTPTFLINGRPMVGSIALDDLKGVVGFELAYSKSVRKDDCCSVQLSLPGASK